MADRKVLLGILDQMGVKYGSRISLERVKKKVMTAIDKQGIPEDILEAETEALQELGYEPEHDEKPEPKPVPEKKPEKKKNGKKEKVQAKPEKEKKPEEKPKKKKEKSPRMSWIEAATHALLSAKKIDEESVVEKAVKMYIGAGGKDVPNLAKWAKLNVRRALKVLVIAGNIREEGGKLVRTE